MGSSGCPPHALLLPYPAQGHVIPLMEFSHRLLDLGFAVTFVTTEHTHHLLRAAHPEPVAESYRLRLVAIPDGLPPDDDRANFGSLTAAILGAMPGHLEELIRKTNESAAGGGGGGGGGGSKITWVVADQGMAWALGVARKMGLRTAVFWPASTGMLAICSSIPKLIEDGVIHPDGLPKAEGEFQLAAGMPAMNASHLIWNLVGDSEVQRTLYSYCESNGRATESAEFVLCNSFPELEPPAFAYAPHPHLLPVGPLLACHRHSRRGDLLGHLLPEDPGWAAWLDEQKPRSVVYAAFGSTAILGRRQFQELALGLELSGRPFLWVARPGLADREAGPAFPEGFDDRVGGRGMVVGWVPQQEVLAHPAVACFVSHCGWNSTMEGVVSGVPFLCWPYFADQFYDRDNICGAWRTGLSVAPDGDGFVTREEIRGKLEALLGDEGIRERAVQLRAVAGRSIEEGGVSLENLKRFVEAMKA